MRARESPGPPGQQKSQGRRRNQPIREEYGYRGEVRVENPYQVPWAWQTGLGGREHEAAKIPNGLLNVMSLVPASSCRLGPYTVAHHHHPPQATTGDGVLWVRLSNALQAPQTAPSLASVLQEKDRQGDFPRLDVTFLPSFPPCPPPYADLSPGYKQPRRKSLRRREACRSHREPGALAAHKQTWQPSPIPHPNRQ